MPDNLCSILCLAWVRESSNLSVQDASIVLFRKLFNPRNVLFFIHFNLAASLLAAILLFVLGIETASGNPVS